MTHHSSRQVKNQEDDYDLIKIHLNPKDLFIYIISSTILVPFINELSLIGCFFMILVVSMASLSVQ